MDTVQNFLELGLIAFGIVVGFFSIVVGLPVWLYHRREMARMRGLKLRQDGELQERVEALEERCDKLEERVTDAHTLLSDEQRAMDRKLAKLLPDDAAPSDGEQESRRREDERRRTIG
jgi:hypothetical protein